MNGLEDWDPVALVEYLTGLEEDQDEPGPERLLEARRRVIDRIFVRVGEERTVVDLRRRRRS